MSLINEALKRARQESRRRDALAKGLPLAPPPSSVSHRSWMVAAVVAMALALLVSLFTIARLATNESTTSPSDAASPDEIDIQAVVGEPKAEATADKSIEPAETTGRVSESTEGVSKLQATAAEVAKSSPSGDDRFSETTQNTDSTSASAASRQSPAGDSESAVASSPPPSGLADLPTQGVSLSPAPRNPSSEESRGDALSSSQVFVERATLASGETLELGGIAWSETGPYALLDERVVGLGESIMGYMVTRIAPQEVELEGGDGTILIRLK